MAQKYDLVAELREDQGKGASRRLRRQGKVPAIIYGAGRPPRNLAFEHNKVIKELENEAFYSSILNIKVGDKSQAAVVKDIQRHPSKRQIMHLDFQRIVEDEKIRMNVPIHFVGEDAAVGVKQGGGSISRLMTDVEVSCLPKDLPEFFEVDVAEMDLNDMLHLSDIKVPEGVEIVALAQGEDQDQPIVSIALIKETPVEDEVDEAAEAAAPDAEGAAPADAGDAEESSDD
ncbi:MAG: 50S ribosomal protein L25/general stress protein Ctc [Pseudomonadota bacterium]